MFRDSEDGITHKEIECLGEDNPNYFHRLEALKLATEIALKINHFENQYSSVEDLLKDVGLLHEIADHNLKYILGKK